MRKGVRQAGVTVRGVFRLNEIITGAWCRPLTVRSAAFRRSAFSTAAMSAIVSQMAEGEITPDEAAVAASVIETKRKALETEELDRRMTCPYR
jgi:hypothetical protein